MFKLRDYQEKAVNTANSSLRRSLLSILIEAATGAGKSLIVANIAKFLNDSSGGKKVLCLAPSKELTEQNHAKYLAYGYPASIYSASAGSKCIRHGVVFGTPQTVANDLDIFGNQFCAVIIDEAHGITPTIKKICDKMKESNPKLRIVGLTATPYRMSTGYIYQHDENNIRVNEDMAVNPFFDRLVYRITAEELVGRGYLTPPVLDAQVCESYDTSNLMIKSNGKFDQCELEQAFEGKGRKTAAIVSEVVALANERNGVMFFAATIQHAEEIMESLPPNNSCMVTGETKKAEREKIVNNFKEMKFKYLVNVSVLTTGFDAPHVDLVAILRATESASLLQQIIGRGLRLYDGKKDCLVLDYADNVNRHELHDNIFAPKIRTYVSNKEKKQIPAHCPMCGTQNEFTARKNPDGLNHDSEGYLIDLMGNRVMIEGKPLPAHYGRRCNYSWIAKGGLMERCDYRWSMKECMECGHENDIAAKYCDNKDCRHELVDPNEKLLIDFHKMKKDPKQQSSDRVLSWRWRTWKSKRGAQTIRIDYTTEYRTFPAWFTGETNNPRARKSWLSLTTALFGGRVIDTVEQFVGEMNAKNNTGDIITVTSFKNGDFFNVVAHNEEESGI